MIGPFPVFDDLNLAVQQCEPAVRNSACSLCELSTGVRTVCIPCEEVVVGSPAPSTILLVMPDPTAEDDRLGRPYCSQQGQFLRRWYAQSGWNGHLLLTTALRCAPGSRKIKPTMLKACRPYLGDVIAQAQARGRQIECAVAFGAQSCTVMIGRSFNPQSCRGGFAVYSSQTVAFPVLIAQHVAAGLRNSITRREIEEVLRRSVDRSACERMLSDRAGGALALYFVVQDVLDAREMCDECQLAGGACVDIETFGRSHNAEFEVLSVSVTPSGTNTAYVIDEERLRPGPVLEMLKDLLLQPGVQLSGQYAKFDLARLRRLLGVVPKLALDSGLMRTMLESDAEGKLEQSQTIVGLGGAKDEAKEVVKLGATVLAAAKRARAAGKPVPSMPDFRLSQEHLEAALSLIDVGDDPRTYAYAFLPADVRRRYNASDTVTSDLLCQHFERRMRAEFGGSLWRHWNEVVVPLHHAITCMEFNGIKIDRTAVGFLQAAMSAQIADITARLKQYGDINYNSNDQIADLLFNKVGIPMPRRARRTPTGRLSVSGEMLESLGHPAASAIVALRKATKFKSTYADGMVRYLQHDGRVHTSYKIDGTTTGRPSTEQPNLLNTPRAESVDGKLCRDLYVAEEGYSLLEGDYSQIELRVAAMLSGDPLMIQAFRDNKDIHMETAKLIAPMLGVDLADAAAMKLLRSRSKTINFAVLYGDPDEGIAAKLGIAVQLAVKLKDAILGKYSVLKRWIAERLSFARQHGYCRTWWDGHDARVRRLPDIAGQDKDLRLTAERSAWNTPVQGTAADFTNRSLGMIQEWLDSDPEIPARLVLTVYDSIVVEVRDDYVVEVAATMKAIMESHNSLGVPIVAEFKYGKSWGTLQEVEELKAA